MYGGSRLFLWLMLEMQQNDKKKKKKKKIKDCGGLIYERVS